MSTHFKIICLKQKTSFWGRLGGYFPNVQTWLKLGGDGTNELKVSNDGMCTDVLGDATVIARQGGKTQTPPWETVLDTPANAEVIF